MTQIRSASIAVALLAAFVLAGPIRADEQPVEAKKPPAGLQMVNPAEQQAADQRLLNTVRQMMQQNNFEGAAGLLESVYQRRPDDQVVMNLLRTCYDQMGQPAKSELLIRRMMEISPNSHILHAFLAESLARQGNTESALKEYETAYSLVRDNNAGLYGQIVRSMQAVGLTDQALAMITRLRTNLSSPGLFAKEAGEIHESRRDYLKAVEEYYTAMADTTHTGIEAENKLFLLLEFQESSKDVIKALRNHTTDSTAARATQILASHFLKAGDMDQAMHFTLLRDSLGGTNGTVLLSFMRTCNERGLYRQATVVGSEIVKRYGASPLLAEARFLYADALTHLGQLDSAISVYDTIIATYPRPQDKAEAGYRIGLIYLDLRGDPRKALVMFDSVTATYAGGLGYLRALLARPDAYIQIGELDRARSSLRDIQARQVNEDIAEEMIFKLAKIDFYDKRFDSAQAAFNRLMVDYPRGFYVNDALQLMLVIGEAGGNQPLLHDYSTALLFAEQRRYDSSRVRLEQIAGADDSSLADVALYRLAGMCMDLQDSTAALGYIDRLAARFPESYYVPFGLKIKADAYVSDPERREEGKAIYRTLLERHPNYPFISEVRKKLRELEWDVKTG